MGILNVTPDSFSDGGNFISSEAAAERAMRMVEEGAGIIDVGGESTRPGAAPVPLGQELDRVIPVIEAIRSEISIPISIDTSKPEVMRQAVATGADMINDVAALREDGAVETAGELSVPACLMHMRGDPRTMQETPHYSDVAREVREFLLRRADVCMRAGIQRERLIIDPGFGFGKTLEHNQILLNELDTLADTGFPLLVGLSRKSMIGELLDAPVERRLYGSLALAVLAVSKGASILRVHDVRATVEAVAVAQAVLQSTDQYD